MTPRQTLVYAILAAALAAALVAVHAAALPLDERSWALNRILHHAWEGLAAAAALGGIVWMMWPRTKARRRDEQRRATQRRAVLLVATILAGMGLVVFAEIRRDTVSHRRLEGQAVADLQALGKAIAAYAADHDGKHPAAAADLVPRYLDPARLYYRYRRGPAPADPPASAADEADPPSYVLVRAVRRPDGKAGPETRTLAYLRPGSAWAPLTAVLERDGRVRVVGEDEARAFEKQAGGGQ